MKIFLPIIVLLLCTLNLNAQTVNIELFKNGFSSPVNLQNAGDERLFVVEQGGLIKIIAADGSINSTPFLNLTSQVSSGSEQGLLGLAFHPDYATNGYFYVNYTNNSGDTQVSRFSVSTGDPDVADPNSELDLLGFTQPFSNHNGGCLAFGPDGFLYISTGDGGSGGDPGNRAQNRLLLLGKLLRIDVDNPMSPNNYGIPADNPFIADPDGRDEIWAYGLRNPWKFSFDSANGDLWIGDVGQGAVEEIDRAPSTDGGLNYGWRCYEGTAPFNTANCPSVDFLTFPIAEYSSTNNTANCSVTGGNVYRGTEFAGLVGLYFYADVCSGLIGTVDTDGNLVEHGTFGGTWVAFGEDVNKELYIVNLSGSIHRIIGEPLDVPEFDPSEFTMIPNPASDLVRLNMKNDRISEIRIYDLKGSLLYSENEILVSEKNIDVSALSQGVYLVRIISEGGATHIKKLVVQ